MTEVPATEAEARGNSLPNAGAWSPAPEGVITPSASLGEGFAFFRWHSEHCRQYRYGMCAYREFDFYCLRYWQEGHNR